MPIERSINIDNKNDFELAKILLDEKLINLESIFSLRSKKYYNKKFSYNEVDKSRTEIKKNYRKISHCSFKT